MSLMTALWIVLAVGWLIVVWLALALCRAAARGDRMTEECSEFDTNWLEPRK